MFALIRKDIALFLKGLNPLLFLVFSVASATAFINNPWLGVWMGLTPVSMISKDGMNGDWKNGARRFLSMLPVSPTKVVGERYLLSLAGWALSFSITVVLWCFLASYGIPLVRFDALPSLALISLSSALVYGAIILAADFIAGTQWGSAFAILAVYGLLGTGWYLDCGKYLVKSFTSGGKSDFTASMLHGRMGNLVEGYYGLNPCLLIFGCALAIYGASFALSCIAYRNRDA